MTAQVIYADFKSRCWTKDEPGEDLEQMAVSILNTALNAHEEAIYESSIGYIAPEADPA